MPVLNQDRRVLNEQFNRIIGINVSTFRTRRGMTQKDLAHHAGMDQTVLNRVETGQRSLKLREGLGIANALGLRVETLTRRNHGVNYTD